MSQINVYNGANKASITYTGSSDISVDIGKLFPSGGIILWRGSIASIPSGWALCDGNNGTPNLKDRFVVGAGNSYAVGATGGSTSASGSGTIIPDGYIEYTEEPVELLDALEAERIASDEIAIAQEKARLKQLALDTITVEVNGKIFDGRDKDQVRMHSAIQASDILGMISTEWKLNDNTIVEVTVDEIKQALALSIQRTGEIVKGE
jgi:hypothetical protein